MSGLAGLLASGTPVVTAEFPVVDADMSALVRHADRLRGWADAVNVTDNTAAHAHASNVAVAVAVRRLGLDPIMQVVCRDKNRLALQADIVGAALHGVRAVCCMTGDDVTAGDEPEARPVFDLDGPRLVRAAASLAEGRYLSGRRLDPAPELLVGAVESPGFLPHSRPVERAVQKVQAGARFLQLQICYHQDRLAAFMAGVARAGLTARAAFLPTICLVEGVRGLRFMDGKLPGVSVPAETIDRVERAADPSAAAYDLALEQARHALGLPGVRGLHLVDFRGGDAVPRLLSDLRISRRPPAVPA
ncbi:methylenetetrahydrofolate reductase [Planomonospora sp. ID67723]|uniref:methylenetetrahydrofolate reductase n=1 Tax=Planomonospora sp. ID67723 TaxID=2738134 RepID=UPI0018C446C8|nr:methylenetetrahydrofolate reductase [Planomonospora sp. ID67723]MBG0828893.1 methylenetetrahydrofolate reductase [Planomonospora sp. ID67723]